MKHLAGFFDWSLQNERLRVLKTASETAGYFPVARYCISPTPGDTMQETSTPKRAQENPQTNRVGAVAGRGVLSTLANRIIKDSVGQHLKKNEHLENMKMKKYKILVDTDVFSIADPARWVRVPPPPGSIFSNTMLLMRGKTKRNEKVQISLQALGNHCRNGNILLFRTSELMYEDWQGFQSMGNNLTNYYAFKNCKVEDIKSPIERSFFYPISNLDGNQLQIFIEGLLKIEFSRLMDMLKQISVRHQNVFEYNTVTEHSFNWFKELCNRLNKNKYRDAFHFWAAEHNKIDFFLTEDKKFRNELSMSLKHGGMESFCIAVGAVELVSQLQIETESITLPEAGVYYDMGEHRINYPWG